MSDDVYGLRTMESQGRVLDIGAYIGEFARECMKRWPDCHVVSIEPSRDMAESICLNMAVYGDRFRLFEGALSPGVGPVYFTKDVRNDGASHTRTTDGVPVNGFSLSAVLRMAGWDSVDLIKCDAEGAELFLFDSPSIIRAKVVVFEYHCWMNRRVPWEQFAEKHADLWKMELMAPPDPGGQCVVRAKRK